MMKMRIAFISILFFSMAVVAKPAVVINPGALVYISPDFDAEVIGQLDEGQAIEASVRKFGPFHRIKYTESKLGYIADNDFAFKDLSNGNRKEKESAKEPHKENLKEKKQELPKKNFSLYGSQFWGPLFSYLSYREDTMGMNPTQKSFFFGAKFVGPDFFIEGDTHTEVNVLLRTSAPEFYKQATGIGTSGWIFLPDFLIQNVQPQSKNLMTSYGYGLMFRYSKYDVGLSNGAGGVNYYSLEDMILGGVANAGFFYRINSMTLRGEYKLYVEKMTYWGLSLSLLFPF